MKELFLTNLELSYAFKKVKSGKSFKAFYLNKKNIVHKLFKNYLLQIKENKISLTHNNCDITMITVIEGEPSYNQYKFKVPCFNILANKS